MAVLALFLFSGLPLTGGTLADGDGGLAWSNENAPAGGSVGAIAGNEDVLVAGTWGEGSFISRDNGNQWTKIENFPAIEEVHNAAFSPHDKDLGFVSGYGGLARTTDGGTTWEHLFDDVSFTGPIAFHPDEDRIAVNYRPQGSFDLHVWISDDRGDTWTDLGSPGSGLWLGDIAFGPTPDHIYTMRNFEGWVTTDGGQTWQAQSEGGRSLARTDDGTLWRAGYGPLKKSTDDGLSWQEVPLPSGNPSRVVARPGGGVFATTNDGIILSTDGGDSWTNLGFAQATWGTTDLFVDPRDPDALFLTDENIGVVWIGPTDFGYSLEGRTNGFSPVPVNTVGASADGSLLLAGGSFGTYGSRDGGSTWTHMGPGMGMASTRAVAASEDGEFVYSGGQTLIFSPWLAYSQDGGRTWGSADVSIGGDGYVSGLATHPDEPETAWVSVWGELTESHVFETTDGGETWEPILITTESVHDVAYHAGTGSILVATGSGVQTQEPVTGAWVAVSPGSGEAHAVATRRDDAFAAVETPQLYRTPMATVPALTAWAPTQDAARDVAPDDAGGAWVSYASGGLDACRATDDLLGFSGECEDATPPEGDVYAALVHPDGDRVFAATLANGLWSAPV